jgi:hypothetical protein
VKYDFDSITNLGTEKYGPAWLVFNLAVMEKLWRADIEIDNATKTIAVLSIYTTLEVISNKEVGT